jgi:site-specific DNA-methyltransferase (adenine-specific)
LKISQIGLLYLNSWTSGHDCDSKGASISLLLVDFEELIDPSGRPTQPYYVTDLGALFKGDCLRILPKIRSETVDTVFADPPFNLNKQYGLESTDRRSEKEYLEWCFKWIDEGIRVLKPGGAFFLYNLPKWNVLLGGHMQQRGLTFRHWIAIATGNTLPIPGRLYPAHYSLLYYTKGKAKTFRKIRTPIEKCRHCGGEVRDYGGHRDAMNPKGVNLKDVDGHPPGASLEVQI